MLAIATGFTSFGSLGSLLLQEGNPTMRRSVPSRARRPPTVEEYAGFIHFGADSLPTWIYHLEIVLFGAVQR
jgi:hypothetical protein